MPEVFPSPFGAVTVDGNRGRSSTRAEMDAARAGCMTAHFVMPPDRTARCAPPSAAVTASAPPPARETAPMTNRLQTGIAAAAARKQSAPTAAVRERGKALMRAQAERQGLTKAGNSGAAAAGTPASCKAMMADMVRRNGGTPRT